MLFLLTKMWLKGFGDVHDNGVPLRSGIALLLCSRWRSLFIGFQEVDVLRADMQNAAPSHC
jgi:hypothetical protein